VALLATEDDRGECREAFEAILLELALTLLPLELSVRDGTFFSVEVGDALTAGFFTESTLVLSDSKDVLFSSEGLELTVGTDTSLLFFTPSDSKGLAFLATTELPFSCCLPAVPVLLLLCTEEPAFTVEVGFMNEDRDTFNSAEVTPSARFLTDEVVPDTDLPVSADARGFTSLASAAFDVSGGASIPDKQNESLRQAGSPPMRCNQANNLLTTTEHMSDFQDGNQYTNTKSSAPALSSANAAASARGGRRGIGGAEDEEAGSGRAEES